MTWYLDENTLYIMPLVLPMKTPHSGMQSVTMDTVFKFF